MTLEAPSSSETKGSLNQSLVMDSKKQVHVCRRRFHQKDKLWELPSIEHFLFTKD